jgi:hypothetical protein
MGQMKDDNSQKRPAVAKANPLLSAACGTAKAVPYKETNIIIASHCDETVRA